MKALILILLSFSLQAQQYFNLKETEVYDVEVIVFAYKKPLPDLSSYSNSSLFDPENFITFKRIQGSEPLFKGVSSTDETNLSIELVENNDLQALANFKQETLTQLNSEWNKIKQGGSTIALSHKSWRVATSDFNAPEYFSLDTNNTNQNFKLSGGFVLSKGRYLHFGNRLNLIRKASDSAEDVVFALTERKQVKPGELHYFDNPWFGVLAKVTEITSTKN